VSEQFRSKQTYPFMMIPHKIWEIGLTGNEIAVFLRIFYRAGFEHECFESRTSIAEACCLSEKTVSNCFAELERLNILQITRRRVENKPNLITINHCDEWLSKRKNFPSEDRPQVKSTPDLEKNLPEARGKITYGTRVPELDSIEQDSFLNTVATAEAAAPQKAIEPEVLIDEPKAKSQKPAGSLIFEAYREAYLRRYNVEPLRNAKTNGICSQISKQLPLDEAIALMHFFLQQNVAFYIQRGHAIQLALGDLQALRTNMLNNQAMSSRQAQLADKQQAQKNALQNYLENREKYALK
jgi:hypothetical protein